MTKKNHFSSASEKGRFDGLVDEGKYLRQSSLYRQILPRTRCRLKTSLLSVAKNPFNQRNLRLMYYLPSLGSLWLKNPRNLRKPWLINDLSPCKTLYISRDSSTDAERSLQNHLFMQNKPNFRKSQMNVTDLLKRNYEQMDTWSSGKNEPNTNPIQTQTKPIQTQYKANSNPIQTQTNPISEAKKYQNDEAN